MGCLDCQLNFWQPRGQNSYHLSSHQHRVHGVTGDHLANFPFDYFNRVHLGTSIQDYWSELFLVHDSRFLKWPGKFPSVLLHSIRNLNLSFVCHSRLRNRVGRQMLRSTRAWSWLLTTKNGWAAASRLGGQRVSTSILYRKLRLTSEEKSIHVWADEDAQAVSAKKRICVFGFAPKRVVFTRWPNLAIAKGW